MINVIVMKKIIKTALILTGLFWFAGCDDKIDPLVEELELDRVLSPIGLQMNIRNQTTIEVNWVVREGVDHYVVEFSEDSLEFNTIIRTVTVLPDELPIQEEFFGQTRYSARVKAVSGNGVDDSKWVAKTIMTAAENIFKPIENGDIQSTEATLTWPEGSEVSHFLIVPGNVQRNITTGEKAAGSAIITGLAGLTNYTVTLYSGNSQRGQIQFKTMVDPNAPNTTSVHPEDDLNAVITAADPGQILVLYPGDYLAYTGNIIINKSITIRGLYTYDRPKLHVQFSLENAAAAIEFADLDLNGDATLNDVFRYNTASVTYGSLDITGCYIHDFTRTLIGGNVASTVQSISINDCVITGIATSGGDFIDFRTAYLADLSITNSTFYNSSTARDFIRMDAAAGFSGTTLTSNVLIDHCTIYGAVNNNAVSNRRLLYVRFVSNELTVRNSIIAESTGFYSNQAATSNPVCTSNNYFNAPRFYDPNVEAVPNHRYDQSGNHTILNPGFVNAASGDFTITNQTLIDNGIGDPRWR